MVLLKALNLPALTPDVLGFLAEQQVVTVEDFLVHDLHCLATEVEGSLASNAIKQAVAALLSYLEKLQDGWSVASEIFEEDGQFLPISCQSVDSLLDGGLQEGTITELVGASSTGKSQMCMQAAASIVHLLHSGVVYVDTCNSFSAKRVAHILEELLDCNQAKGKWDHLGIVMKGIKRIGIFDVFSLLSFLRCLHESLQSKSKIAEEFSNIRLLVIDSASSIVSPVLGGSNARGHALMISLAQSLNKLAVVNKIAVLITNHTVTGDEGQMQPALGESWISVPHVRLWLERDPSSDLCTISLTKHASLSCNNQAAFHIGKAGLHSVDEMGKVSRPSLTISTSLQKDCVCCLLVSALQSPERQFLFAIKFVRDELALEFGKALPLLDEIWRTHLPKI